jgi:ABC-type multidrug transport system fused ATPase/permease subunit
LFSRGVRLIWSYIRTHPKPFAISVAGAFVFALASVGVSVALGRVTDRVLRPADGSGVSAETMWLGAAAIMALATVRALSIMVRRYYSGVAGAAVAATLRSRVSDLYRQLSFEYHRTTPTGELLSHMEADVEAAVDVYYPVPFSVGAMFLAIFALVALLVADPFLATIGLVIVPTTVLLNRSFAGRMQGPAQRGLGRIADVSAVAHESIDGALIVKTLGREPAETERLRASAEDLRDARIEAGYLRAAFEPALEAMPSVAVVVMLAVGSWRVSVGSITLGTLIAAVTLFGLLAWPMRFVGWILSQLPRVVIAHDRIVDVLEQPVRVRPPADPVDLPEGPSGSSSIRSATRSRGSRCWTRSPSRCVRTRPSRSWGRPGWANRRSRSSWSVWTTPPTARSRSAASIFDGPTPLPCGGPRRSCSRRASCSRPQSARTSSWNRARVAGTWRKRLGSRGPTPSSAGCPEATTPWSASAATRSPAASGSGSRSRGPSSGGRGC